MVSAATGVMNSAVNKLTAFLGEEYRLVTNVKQRIRFMRDELSSMHAVLQRLDEVDDDQIDVQTKDWRSKVRELSYDIEDCVDRFMLLDSSKNARLNFVQSMVCKIKELWEDRKISKAIKELKDRVVEEKKRRDRYDIGQHLTITPPSEEKQLKVVSIFGIGGQGKTTLAMEVYRRAEELFDCRASVSISRTFDMKKLLRDILSQINESEYDRSERWEMEQLIRKLRGYLMDKRYLIVIDDIWSISAWEQVKCALPVNNTRSRIIATTRSREVAESCCTGIDGYMYEAKPLCEDDARTLFFRRIFHSNEACPLVLMEVATEILRKCGGLPLAIISIAGLLSNRSHMVEEWEKILKSISSAVATASQIQKMKRILFLSYFDLPLHLKSCLLYLSVFPEDYSIDCRQLIRTWVAEGLIPGQDRETMEQLGESYLNELIKRSMVQPTKIRAGGAVKSCRVHDVILDFIVSQAVEDNFLVIGNGKDLSGNFADKMRRLSIQTDFSGEEEIAKALKNASHLRSVHMFNNSDQLDDHIPQFFCGHVLRVLNIKGRCLFRDCNVHIENLTQLKLLVALHRHFRDYLPWPLSAIPSQMRSFVNLVRLRISVQNKVTKEGMEILASLPMLASLTVRLMKYDDDIHHARHTVSKQGFQSLLKFSFGGDQEAALEFEAGAMPKVQSLKVELQARCQFKYGQGGLVLGLHNLAVLKYVTVNINCFKAAEEAVQDLEDVRGALGTHPNHPILVIKREHTHGYDASDDQLIK
ncbi:unnamed protein product [Urochloa decumbens]|uniref:Uncharacterized protein n=1 Tax=Urochloa decumbens TaxID=240449 RepID=A0ABC8VIV1_9POAL